jgi:hypothetical protein
MAPLRTELGDRGEAVRAWQAYLVRHGHTELACDGIHGAATEAASQAWDALQSADRASQASAQADDVRARIVALARSYVGCSCRTREGRERYLELVAGPGDTDSAMVGYLTAPKTSGCGLTVRGLWRRCGLRHPLLEARYRPGMAMSDVQMIAREAGAWRTGLATPPQPGDAVLIDRPNGGHFFAVTDVSPGPLLTIDSVDGGASDGGAQAIAARHRVWTNGAGGRIVDTRDGGGSYAVLGWCDVAVLRW